MNFLSGLFGALGNIAGTGGNLANSALTGLGGFANSTGNFIDDLFNGGLFGSENLAPGAVNPVVETAITNSSMDNFGNNPYFTNGIVASQTADNPMGGFNDALSQIFTTPEGLLGAGQLGAGIFSLLNQEKQNKFMRDMYEKQFELYKRAKDFENSLALASVADRQRGRERLSQIERENPDRYYQTSPAISTEEYMRKNFG